MKTFILFIAVLLPVTASAASPALSLSPEQNSVSVGDTFSVEVLVDTQGQNANAVASYVEYPADLLSVVSLDISEEVPFRFLVEQNYGNGKIEVSGGTPTPGFTGTYTVATVEFQALEAGEATLSFLEGSAVLSDSENANLLRPADLESQTSIRIAQAQSPVSVREEVPYYQTALETFLVFLKKWA